MKPLGAPLKKSVLSKVLLWLQIWNYTELMNSEFFKILTIKIRIFEICILDKRMWFRSFPTGRA